MDKENVPGRTTPGLFVSKEGRGPRVVLVHGWGFHGGVWGQVAGALAARFRVLRVDLPGHGKSNPGVTVQTPLLSPPLPLGEGWGEGSNSRGSERLYPGSGADDLESWAEALADAVPGPALWVGWSLGATLALYLAATRPEQVKGLVVVAGTPCFCPRPDWPHAISHEELGSFGRDLETNWRGTLLRFFALHSRGGEADTVRALRRGLLLHPPAPTALRSGLGILRDQDLRPLLRQVRCPTLVLAGGRDPLIPEAGARDWVDRLEHGRLEVLPAAGHMPFVSHFGEFEYHLSRFADACLSPGGQW